MSFISPQPCSSSGGSHQGEFILCDNNGPFIRKFIQDDSGTVTDVVDLTIDGVPYIVVGTVELCPTAICAPMDPIPVCFDISCETDSITVCPPASGAFHVIVDSAPPITGISVTVELDCETDSITVCPPASGQFHVIVDNSFPITVELDCETDSITVCPPPSGFHVVVDNTIPVSGTVTVNQGTSPWIVSGTVAATQSGVWSVGRTWTLNSGTDSVTAMQGTSPWIISGPVTQGAAPWTVRLQDGTTGQLAVVDAAGDLQVDVNNFPATQVVTQGTSPWVVSGTVATAQAGVWNVGRTWNLSYLTDSVSVEVANASTASAPALTVTGAAAIVLAANPLRRSFTLQNTSTVPIMITFGATNPTATVYHFALAPGSISDDGKGSFFVDDQWTGDVRAFSSTAGSLVIMEIT